MLVISFDPRVSPRDEEELTAVSLSHCSTALATAHSGIVATGAGISTSAGIPDFRGTHGIYKPAAPSVPSSSQESSFPPSSPSPTLAPPITPREARSLFDATIYHQPSLRSRHWQYLATLHTLVDSITRAHRDASPTHAFFRLLKRRGLLRRVYTQNIDGLEVGRGTGALEFVDLPGITATRRGSEDGEEEEEEFAGDVVQLHGSIMAVRCTACDWAGPWEGVNGEAFAQGSTTDCPACVERTDTRRRQLKRSPSLRSFIRPSIVLYNEVNPAETVIGAITEDDLSSSPDFLLVFGTSLKIPGFRRLVKDIASVVHAKGGLCVFVNADEVSSEWDDVFDYHFLCKTDDFVERIEADWRDACPGQFASDRSPSPSLSPSSSVPRPSPPESPQTTPSPGRKRRRRETSSAPGKRRQLDAVKLEATQDEMDEEFLIEDSGPERSDLAPLCASMPSGRPSRAQRKEEQRLRREKRAKRRKRRADRAQAREETSTT